MTDEDEKECMFCLEIYLKRKTTVIWYSGLYPCECRFASHWQCLLKWQWQCDDVLECPICRTEVLVEMEPELDTILPDTSRIFYTEPQPKNIYRVLIYSGIVFMFLSAIVSLFGKH